MATEEKDPKPIIGTKYYTYVNNEVIMVRFLRIKNNNCYVVEAAGRRFNMTKAEFSSYTKLNPDGYVTFCVAVLDDSYNITDKNGTTNMNQMQKDTYIAAHPDAKIEKIIVKDVIVTFHRKQDISTAEQIPFAVCRQNVMDVYANTLNNQEGIIYVGCSLNIDSCPSDLDYKMLMACNGIEEMEMIAVYIEDNLDDVLRLVNPLPYDDVLRVLAAGYTSPDNVVKSMGACDSVKMLLEQNHFVNDIYYGFKELKVDFKYIPELAMDLIHAVEDVIKHTMINPVWVAFTRDIDLAKIEDQYIIVRDSEDSLYVVSYKEGEYTNRPYFAMDDHTEYDKLIELSQYRK